MNKKSVYGFALFVLSIIGFVFVMCVALFNVSEDLNRQTIRIISSTDNKDLEPILDRYAAQNNIDILVDYAGTLEIMENLNEKNNNYDAVWVSNSMWLYMLDGVKTSDSKIINMNPVVFGIRKS